MLQLLSATGLNTVCVILSVKTIDRTRRARRIMYVSNVVPTWNADCIGFQALGSGASLPMRQRPLHRPGVQQPWDRHSRPRRQDRGLQGRPGRSVSGHRSVGWRLVCVHVGTPARLGCRARQHDLIVLSISCRECRQQHYPCRDLPADNRGFDRELDRTAETVGLQTTERLAVPDFLFVRSLYFIWIMIFRILILMERKF